MKNLDINKLFSVKNKVAVITGATGGFGRAASIGLAQAGAKIVVTGRSESKLKPLVAEIKQMGGEATYAVGSPDNHDDVKSVVAHAVESFGGIDILITAAGHNSPAPIIEQSVEEWDQIMDANVKGTWLFCKEVGKVMIEQGRGGKVIIVSSARGLLGMSNYSAYCPSKGATNLLTKTLACEWGANGINVNAIGPTVFRTDLTQWMFEDDAVYKKFLTRIPIGRLGEPEDFIGSIIYLSSKASDFLTGSIIYVDGGYTAG